jgi:HAE1 family hydrophobic/amphiphilic exporter-1
MQKLAEVCVLRPVFASVLILVLVVVGIAGYLNMGVDQYPSVDLPIVVIYSSLQGTAPETMETEVTNRIEEGVSTISGIDELTSTSSEGRSVVTITFNLGVNIDSAVQDVRDHIATVKRQLPTGMDDPTVFKVDPNSQPVLTVAITGPGSIKDTSEYADKVLTRQIENINGVGQVNMRGGRLRQINIILNANKMQAFNVSTTDVVNALQAQNLELPGGEVEQPNKTLTVRTLGRMQNVSDFNNIILRATNGGQVLLSDVGVAQDGMQDKSSASEIDGQPMVSLQILKQSGTNTIAVIDAIKARLVTIREGAPKGYQIRVIADQSEYVEAALHAVQEHLYVGAILASLVVLLFLMNWRSTIIAALAIPSSIISTFGLISYLGFTLNSVTLLALTLSVGIVIDDGIVVLENISRFLEEKNMSPAEAAIEGTREIGLAVMATSLSLIAVFLPVAFMSGVVGQFMHSFGVTMACAIAVSLLVSFTLTPSLCARWLKSPSAEHAATKNTREHGFFSHIDHAYTSLLVWCMHRRWIVIVLCVASLISIVPLMGLVSKNFLPDEDQSQFQVSVELPLGASVEATQKVGRRLDKEIEKYPWIEYTSLTSGGSSLNRGSIFVKMKPIADRSVSQQEAIVNVRKKFSSTYKAQGIKVSVGPVNNFSGGGGSKQAEIQYIISGPDMGVLEKAVKTLIPEMSKIPHVVDADSSLELGQPQISVHVDRKMAQQLGVQPSDVANAMNYLVGDQQVTDFTQGGEDYEVHVRAAPTFRTTLEGLKTLTVPSSTLGSVPISSVVTFEQTTGPASIDHYARQRQVTLLANTTPGGSQQEIVDQLEQLIKNLNLGPEYSVHPAGTVKTQQESMVAFLMAVMLSFVFMYLILAAQFESWLHPVTILLSLPLTLPFALLSLVLFNQSFNLFSILGVLVLFGVVKKNAILQIDHSNQLREQGMNRFDAIILANRHRLRPILMTTIAFVAGMLPLLISGGAGAGENRSIASVIAGGQTLSLLLVLVAIPVVYSLFDDATQMMAHFKRSLAARSRLHKQRKGAETGA